MLTSGSTDQFWSLTMEEISMGLAWPWRLVSSSSLLASVLWEEHCPIFSSLGMLCSPPLTIGMHQSRQGETLESSLMHYVLTQKLGCKDLMVSCAAYPGQKTSFRYTMKMDTICYKSVLDSTILSWLGGACLEILTLIEGHVHCLYILLVWKGKN